MTELEQQAAVIERCRECLIGAQEQLENGNKNGAWHYIRAGINNSDPDVLKRRVERTIGKSESEQQRVDEEQLIRQSEVITALIDALRECEVEIDMAIDNEYPASAHVHFARQNAHLKAHNPARIALDAYDAGRGK